MHTHPLAEVFGFPPDNFSLEAKRYRKNKLCPFNNRVPSCTKDKANDPLGVCSILEKDDLTIVCPIRFRERWIVTDDAAAFFFPPGVSWTTLTEVRLNDKHGKSAGNIDVVLVAYDDSGRLLDFGALEIQSVYISGNIRRPFTRYMSDPHSNYNLDWTGHANYPRPDYLSSSRKRLAPQLIYKGGILNSWGKKMAVALHNSFYETLPTLPEVEARKRRYRVDDLHSGERLLRASATDCNVRGRSILASKRLWTRLLPPSLDRSRISSNACRKSWTTSWRRMTTCPTLQRSRICSYSKGR